ncbi:MAG: lipid-A-disaccharide synthase N-terminal domain-containing protein [Porphyromonas sp.]|nr:lipid-A-disaccharide synthase N-terminal domain-containing protein [Porphyromonas sp.]
MSNSIITLSIGFLAQLLFSARILVQWILSERAKRVLSPTLFWVLSLLGSYLFFIYGWLRDDFAIILGQFISYYIYLENLRMKGVWQRLPKVLSIVLLATPIAVVAFVAGNASEFVARFLHNDDVATWLLLFGSTGQVLFTLRFVYQWFYSRRKNESRLPAGFWIISLTGSLLILTYGVIRADIVLIVGQMFGAAAYSRNLWLIAHEVKNS